MIPTFGPPPTQRSVKVAELIRAFHHVRDAYAELAKVFVRVGKQIAAIFGPAPEPDPYWTREAVLARAAVRAGTGQIAVTLYPDGIGAEW